MERGKCSQRGVIYDYRVNIERVKGSQFARIGYRVKITVCTHNGLKDDHRESEVLTVCAQYLVLKVNIAGGKHSKRSKGQAEGEGIDTDICNKKITNIIKITT